MIFWAAVASLAFVSSAAASLQYVFNSGTAVAVSGASYTANGNLVVSLGFRPSPGTNLTVVKNNGPAFISGIFNGVPQGGIVPLTHNGVTYNYIANYYGGNGRSLVLQWPCTGLIAWGADNFGQLGNNSTTVTSMPVAVPVAVTTSGALAGKTALAMSTSSDGGLALTSDGKVFTWGANSSGQLGNNTTQSSSVPVKVDTSGALAGKTVVAIAKGWGFSLALTSDGQVFAWGNNSNGQLGNNSTTSSSVPVAVNTSGALAGKTVVVISAGGDFSLALTSDGQVFAWGNNSNGQLGNNNSTTSSSVPVAVNTSGVLAGKTVVAISAGPLFTSLALTSEGQVCAWGGGALGNINYISSSVPVLVDTSGGLSGKIVVGIAGGWSWNHAMTSDGQLFAWGNNDCGSFGDSGTSSSIVPVAVITSGALAGKTVMSIVSSGTYNSLALCGSGDIPSISANPVSNTGTVGGNVTFMSMSNDNPTPSLYWQVSATGTAGTFSNITDNSTATTGTLTLTNVTSGENGYAYRAVYTNSVGSVTTSAAILTVLTPYAAWQNIWFTPTQLSDPTMSGTNATPAKDGITNLMKYALNLSPNQNQSANIPSPVVTGSQMSLNYYAGSAGVTYSVEVSSDLQTWTTSGVSISPPDLNNFSTATVPLSGTKQFMRLKVSY